MLRTSIQEHFHDVRLAFKAGPVQKGRPNVIYGVDGQFFQSRFQIGKKSFACSVKRVPLY